MNIITVFPIDLTKLYGLGQKNRQMVKGILAFMVSKFRNENDS